jgi:AraC family L-rhamnose operon transcriptional activator RhaR/AraC family L-rhamnose operon regulatory protein RhaS
MRSRLKLGRELVFGERDFPMDVSTWENHPDYPMHTHDFSEIVVIVTGTGVNVIGKERFPFTAGNVFVLPGNLPHAYTETHKLTVINITFDPALIARLNYGITGLPGYQALFVVEPAFRERGRYGRYMHLQMNQLLALRALTDVMEKEIHQAEPGYELMAMGHFMILITMLSRWHGTNAPPETSKIINIGRAISHMEAHYEEPIELDHLARITCMSRRNFYRIFKEVTKEAPLAYLLRLRIMKAVHLLEMTDKTITEVAFECGFGDSNYFSRQFRQIMGIAPGKFKRHSTRFATGKLTLRAP